MAILEDVLDGVVLDYGQIIVEKHKEAQNDMVQVDLAVLFIQDRQL